MRDLPFKVPETLGFVKEFQSSLRLSIPDSFVVRKSVLSPNNREDW